MAWRNHADHKQETKAVKEAMIKAGYKGVKVGHGRGTAWGWLEVSATIPVPDDCYCKYFEGYDRCLKCKEAWHNAYGAIIKLAQEVTGRHGEYSGEINAYIDFDKTKEEVISQAV